MATQNLSLSVAPLFPQPSTSSFIDRQLALLDRMLVAAELSTCSFEIPEVPDQK